MDNTIDLVDGIDNNDIDNNKRKSDNDSPDNNTNKSLKLTFHSIGESPSVVRHNDTLSISRLSAKTNSSNESQEEYYKHLFVGPEAHKLNNNTRICIICLDWRNGDIKNSMKADSLEITKHNTKKLLFTNFMKHLLIEITYENLISLELI